ncbi:hypothetical protein [Piscirickettsia litoralis]|uniref:hypothetical protein n=1 Tax=Piscirickettsia litoralis TaxID=1891921 RepID=UPI0019125BE3|nr:hypothetical protein [Piscirickettsia litoralis]
MTPFQKQFGNSLEKSRQEKIAARKLAAKKKQPKPKAASTAQLETLVGRFNKTS